MKLHQDSGHPAEKIAVLIFPVKRGLADQNRTWLSDESIETIWLSRRRYAPTWRITTIHECV
jgi:hypothetical protein